jgi:preprotein translocase SecE subunit
MGEANPVLIDPFPLLDTLKVSTCIAIGVLLVSSMLIYGVLRRSKIAATLTETELEMQKVTWPTWGEAWHGTMAVAVMVLVLFVFLSVVDLLFTQAMFMLMGGGGA